MTEQLFDESKKIADSILDQPASIGKKLIEIADNLRSLAKVKNDDEIEFCFVLIKRWGMEINISRYSMFTEMAGIKVKEISKEDVEDVVLKIKELIEKLDVEKTTRDRANLFEIIKNLYFACSKVPTI